MLKIAHDKPIGQRTDRVRRCFEMTVEKRSRFRGVARLLFNPNDSLDRPRHERLDPVEALNCARAAPALKKLVPLLQGSDLSHGSADFIRIEDAGGVAVRIEMKQSAGLIERDVF